MEGWEEALQKVKKDIIPIKKRPFPYKDAPMIVNMVSTISILPQGYKLPLQAIATMLGACSQFEPTQFAANIIKLTTSTSDVTVLIFSSGKLVLTATVTEMQTQYMAHIFRLLIEKVECCLLNEQGKVEIGTLAGRTVFNNALTHNMVGHGDLGVRIDLRALRNANPDSVKWLPDGFPAAKCCVWLTEDNQCHCYVKDEDEDVRIVVPKLLRKRCACTIKCLCFPTGRIVMTGGRSVQDINNVFYRMKLLAPHFEIGIRSILVKRDSSSSSNKIKGEKIKTVLSEDESVALLLASLHQFKPKRIKAKPVNKQNVLLSFAEAGAFESVLNTLLMEGEEQRENVKTTIDRLSSIERSEEQTKILEYLRKVYI
jgi:TATA-box binding protein (TBP) (component of TFIID and TFIIIB)